jgi:hypothetical protein
MLMNIAQKDITLREARNASPDANHQGKSDIGRYLLELF